MADAIEEFRGSYYFLSNFYECEFEFEGVRYKNSEAAFQAQKNLEHSGEFSELSAKDAKALGRKVYLRSDWDDVKDYTMYQVVREKFRDPELKKKLLATGDKVLIEGNQWHDNYWGKCFCSRCRSLNRSAKNVLGSVLMLVRDELRKEEGQDI